MRLGFCGSPALAVPVLDALVAAGHDVALVVSMPDRPRDRRGRSTPTPVKAAAQRHGIDVADDVTALVGRGLDLAVVVAYGAMVPTSVLCAMPVLNLHFSLLPRWRGAAPVERAILAGDAQTGVCVMGLEPTLDTGPVYARETVEVGDKDLATLRDELVAVGTSLLVALLAGSLDDLPEPVAQVGDATYARKVRDDELVLDFARPAVELARVVRLGRARTWANGRRLLVRLVEVLDDSLGPPGSVHGDVVSCGAGALRVVRVVPEGRAEMGFDAFVRGLRDGGLTELGAPGAP